MIRIETINLNQTQIEVIIQTIEGTVRVQTFGIDTIPLIVQEILEIIEIETTQIVKIESVRTIDHKTTPKLDHIIIIISIDPVIILEKDTTTIKINQEVILSQHIEKILNILTRKIKTKSTLKDQRQINQVQPTDETKSDLLSIDNTETSEKLLNHIHCETTDDESDTENTLFLTSLQLNMNMEHQLNQIITKRKL